MGTSAEEASSIKKEVSRGAWTANEDQKLAETVAIHGPRKWKAVATKAGLNRCGKSCRLRWLNYLRPNIKRGNISDQEEDLILRLHKLLGNRWSLIAGRLPGRTDNEIKNYWNSHLSKKLKQSQKQSKSEESRIEAIEESSTKINNVIDESTLCTNGADGDLHFDLCNDGPLTLEWVSKFLELDEGFV